MKKEKEIREYKQFLENQIKTTKDKDKLFVLRHKLKVIDFVLDEQETALLVLDSGPMELYKDNPYPNNLHAIKANKGLSNQELANLTGCCYTTIAMIDRGEKSINPEIKKLIEDVTGCKVITYYV